MDVCRYANPAREPHELRSLTSEESWLLLQLQVFRKPEFPPKLKDEGKLIADQCRGLPLAVVHMAKRLSASNEANEMSLEAALKEASESFNADLDFHLIPNPLSFENLPMQLRNCFLYIGMFPEDYLIPTWKLIRMWIAEGFIQEEDGICLEETAEEYLDDLISYNLLRVGILDGKGKVKMCTMHKSARYLCFCEAIKETNIFFKEIRPSRSEGSTLAVSEVHKYQRICIHSNVLKFLSGKPYCPSVHSFVCFSEEYSHVKPELIAAIPRGFKQLRVLDVLPLKTTMLPTDMYELPHLRYLTLSIDSAVLPTPFSKFRNIQTLVVITTSRTLDIRADILNMIELRHFKTNASATLLKPDTSSKGGENIQTLGMISPESCTEEVFDRVRSLKELSVCRNLALLLEGNNRSFNSLGKLENIEKLKLINDVFPKPPSLGKLRGLPPANAFPIKLRSLTLLATFLDWSHMYILGSLENLEVLKLKEKAFVGHSWEASDGGFPHLQVLLIDHTDLQMWVASHHHFPRLKCLELRNCMVLLDLSDWPVHATSNTST